MSNGRRTRWRMATAAILGLGIAALVQPSLLLDPARAEESGDRIAVTLTSGKTFRGTLVSRDTRYLKIRMGEYEIDLPSRLVDTVVVEENAHRAAPASRGGSSGATPESTDTGGVVPDADPEPSLITLKDGRTLKGWIVRQDDDNVWVVFGSVHPIMASEVDSVDGGTPLTGGGGDAGGESGGAGETLTESQRLVGDLASTEPARQAAAAAALEAMGSDGVDACIAGLGHENPFVRQMCVGLLARIRTERYHDEFLRLLKSDPDPRVRVAVAGGFEAWNIDKVREALLVSVAKDKDEGVRIACLKSLRRKVTVRDAPRLMTIMGFIPDESALIPPMCDVLKRATAKNMAPQKRLWVKWWDEDGGRQQILDMLDANNAANGR